MISKELLGEVLQEPIYAEPYVKGNELFWIRFYLPSVDDGIEQEVSINLYELAHKCKEWAVSKGYTLVEAPLMLRITRLCTNQNKIWEYTLEEQNNGEYFKPEYTFKACEWVRTQIAS